MNNNNSILDLKALDLFCALYDWIFFTACIVFKYMYKIFMFILRLSYKLIL